MAHIITLHVIYSHPGINISSTNLFIETHNGTHLLFTFTINYDFISFYVTLLLTAVQNHFSEHNNVSCFTVAQL